MYEGLNVEEVSSDEAKLFASVWMKDVTGRVLGKLGNCAQEPNQPLPKEITAFQGHRTRSGSSSGDFVRKQKSRRNISSSSQNNCAGVPVIASKGWPHAEDAAKRAAETACLHDFCSKEPAAVNESSRPCVVDSHRNIKYQDKLAETLGVNHTNGKNFLQIDKSGINEVGSEERRDVARERSPVTKDDLLEIWGLDGEYLQNQGYIPDHVFRTTTAVSDDLRPNTLDYSTVKTTENYKGPILADLGEFKDHTVNTGDDFQTAEMVAINLSSTGDSTKRITSQLDPLAADFKPDARNKWSSTSVGNSKHIKSKEVDGRKRQELNFQDGELYRGSDPRFHSPSASYDHNVNTYSSNKVCKCCFTGNSPDANWCFECGTNLLPDTAPTIYNPFQYFKGDENRNPNIPIDMKGNYARKDTGNDMQRMTMTGKNCSTGFNSHHLDRNNSIEPIPSVSYSLSPPVGRFNRRFGDVAHSYDEGLEAMTGPKMDFHRVKKIERPHSYNSSSVPGTRHFARTKQRPFSAETQNVASDISVDHRECFSRADLSSSMIMPHGARVPKFDDKDGIQGNGYTSTMFDLEWPSADQDNLPFNDVGYVTQFVQAGIARQVKHWYGVSPRHYEYAPQGMSSKMLGGGTPGHSHLNKSGNPSGWTDDLNRIYNKKKFYHSTVQTPQSPRSKAGQSRGNWKKRKATRKAQHEIMQMQTMEDEDTNVVSTPVEIPKLAFEDLESYDEILTLIRTSRAEALPFLCLPEEIILYVFSFLTMQELTFCARVCKQFHRISSDESLWKEISLRKRSDINDETLMKIAIKHPVSLSITQSHGKKVTTEGLRTFFKECGESLEELDFSACSGGAFVGESMLLYISMRCAKLRSLDISWCNVGNTGIESVADVSPRLECLCINGCQAVTDTAINHVVKKHGESLRILEVFGCFNITQSALLFLAQHCPNLETLNIGQCHKITDVSMSHLAFKLQNLENLDLRGCIKIRDSAVKDISQHCLTLSTLVLANCPLITDASLVALAANTPSLRRLDLCGCGKLTDKGIQALAKSCHKLEVLDLSSTGVTQKSVFALANYCCSNLQSLKVSFCYNVTESSILHLVKKCRSLKLLHLYGCKRLRNLEKIKEGNVNLKVEGENSN